MSQFIWCPDNLGTCQQKKKKKKKKHKQAS